MATGIEVVGLILGAIPLLIEGVKAYRNICGKSSRSGMKRALETLLTQIQAEETILREINDILRDEAAIDWIERDQVEKKVELRLGNCSEAFTRTAEDMQKAFVELKQKLELDSNGKLAGQSLFARVRFILRESDFENLVERLRKDNETLMKIVELTRKTVVVEPKPGIAKQATVIGAVRHWLKNACSALSQAMGCNCPQQHITNLRIEAYPTHLLKHGDVEELTGKISMHVVVLFGAVVYQHSNPPWHWEEITVKRGNLSSPPQQKAKTQTLALGTSSPNKMAVKKQKARIQLPTASQTHHPGASHLNNICDALCRKQCLPNTDYYGYIVDASVTDPVQFTIHPCGSTNNNWSILSLRDVLQNHGKTLPELRYGHKMKLAALVARALLQLSASSWLPELLTSENIVLFRADDATIYDSIYVSMPILPARPPALQLNLPTQITKDEQRLFSLGIILVELVLGTCWEQIRASTGSTADRDIAQDKLREVREVNEFCYLAAKYCINLEIVDNNRDLETRELRKDVCEKVVDRLEDNL